MTRLRDRLRALLRLLRRALAALALFSVAQVLALRWVNPPVTWTMLEEAWRHHGRTGDWVFPEHVSLPLALQGPFPDMAVAAEDAFFWHHNGLDWEALRQALAWNRAHEGLRGGSTISQQVAKNVFLWQEPSLLRKGLEVWYVLWMELLLPKERILEVYGNVAETGPMAFGVGAGARRWFGVEARALSERQAARIAAVLPSPRRWDARGAEAGRRAARILDARVPRPGQRGFEDMAARWRERRPGG